MGSEAKKTNGAGAGAGAGAGGFRAKMEHYLYSGEKKHVAAGIAVIGVLFGVPWYFMTRGSLFIPPYALHDRVKVCVHPTLPDPTCGTVLAPSSNLTKITWKKLIRRGVRDSLLEHPYRNNGHH